MMRRIASELLWSVALGLAAWLMGFWAGWARGRRELRRQLR